MGINLTKEVQDLYTENYKTLLKEIKDQNKCKDILYFHGSPDDIVKVLPKFIYRFKAIPVKIPAVFFVEDGKWDPIIYMQMQETQNSQNNLEKAQS